jgi:hypothetical protein
MLPLLVEIAGPRLHQILLNLLANASKFTRDGSVTLAIAAEPRGDTSCRLEISVIDTGVGIDLDQRPNIFGAFQQIQAANGSTGLGLFIAERIVTTMGGHLRVASALGKGSTFSFEFNATVVGEGQGAWVRAVPAVSSAAPLRIERVPPMPAPGDSDLEELADLARNGNLTDIEQWLHRLAPITLYAGFLAQIQERLDELDFMGIEAIADAARKA